MEEKKPGWRQSLLKWATYPTVSGYLGMLLVTIILSNDNFGKGYGDPPIKPNTTEPEQDSRDRYGRTERTDTDKEKYCRELWAYNGYLNKDEIFVQLPNEIALICVIFIILNFCCGIKDTLQRTSSTFVSLCFTLTSITAMIWYANEVPYYRQSIDVVGGIHTNIVGVLLRGGISIACSILITILLGYSTKNSWSWPSFSKILNIDFMVLVLRCVACYFLIFGFFDYPTFLENIKDLDSFSSDNDDYSYNTNCDGQVHYPFTYGYICISGIISCVILISASLMSTLFGITSRSAEIVCALLTSVISCLLIVITSNLFLQECLGMRHRYNHDELTVYTSVFCLVNVLHLFLKTCNPAFLTKALNIPFFTMNDANVMVGTLTSTKKLASKYCIVFFTSLIAFLILLLNYPRGFWLHAGVTVNAIAGLNAFTSYASDHCKETSNIKVKALLQTGIEILLLIITGIGVLAKAWDGADIAGGVFTLLTALILCVFFKLEFPNAREIIDKMYSNCNIARKGSLNKDQSSGETNGVADELEKDEALLTNPPLTDFEEKDDAVLVKVV